MRKDLNKLLCEEERNGSSRNFKEVRRARIFQIEDEEFSAGRESMTKRYHVIGNNKNFGEHLTPLYGIVRKNVGRKWDDVYSELCEVFDMRSVVNAHILQHLWFYVERYVYVDKDGELMVRGSWRFGAESLATSSCEYFIHPGTGILTKNEHYKTYTQRNREGKEKREAEKRKTCIVISKTQELRRIGEDSPWFVCTLTFLAQPKGVSTFVPYTSYGSRVPYTSYGSRVNRPTAGFWTMKYPDITAFDAWTKKTVPHYQTWYCSSYRSASKKDLKNAGLKD